HRALLSGDAGADVRWRHQRGAARHHLHGGARHPACAVLAAAAASEEHATMDFGFDADQEALRKLAQKALAAAKQPEGMWGELGRAGLLSVALPVEQGGSGLGMIELGLVLEQAGKAAAPAALVPTQVAALAVAQYGSAEQRAWLERALSGDGVVTAALH